MATDCQHGPCCHDSDCRTATRAGTLARMLEAWANRSEHRRRLEWAQGLEVGTDVAGRATVIGRFPGVAIVVFADGHARTLYAPPPLA